MISDDQLLRYNRQIMLPQMDVAGQEKLLAAKVLIVGMGGLGCPVSLYLAAAGVGELILADGDKVDISNLQRQIAHTEADIDRAKVDSVADSIAAINSDLTVRRIDRRLQGEELRRQVAAVDLVVDATDNFSTRLEINRACVELARPLVSGAAIRSEGQVLVIDTAAGTPCYHCVYPQVQADEELSCSENGVLAPMVGVIGSLQALEAVKLLSGYGEPLRGQLLLIDGWSLQVRRIKLKKNPQCPHCSQDRAVADDSSTP